MIIIDEMSMVDLPLMHALLKAIVVGDKSDFGGRQEPASVCRSGKCAERYH